VCANLAASQKRIVIRFSSMSLKHRLRQLERLKSGPEKILAYFENQESLEEAKAKRGWQNIPDSGLKIIHVINAPKIRYA
jgi:hypothetical protein